MNALRTGAETYLPEGCPFILGGGIVRDAILGGRPGDIDIWLPSNITRYADVQDFVNYLAGGVLEGEVRILFEGPGARTNLTTFAPAAVQEHEYGDVSNRWVVEIEGEGIPRINFMRTMFDWTGDSQAFFNSLMQKFDIDQCMYFVGYMPGQTSVNTVICPQHLATMYNSRVPAIGGGSRIFLNELYWNSSRLDSTSEARVQDRLNKMYDKYSWTRWTVEQMHTRGLVLPTEHLIATPVHLLNVMRKVNRQDFRAYPMPGNTRTAAQRAEFNAQNEERRRRAQEAYVQLVTMRANFVATTVAGA